MFVAMIFVSSLKDAKSKCFSFSYPLFTLFCCFGIKISLTRIAYLPHIKREIIFFRTVKTCHLRFAITT